MNMSVQDLVNIFVGFPTSLEGIWQLLHVVNKFYARLVLQGKLGGYIIRRVFKEYK